MNVLGIETSCDETAAAVVKNGCEILSNVVVSSLNQHKKFGGIIPEIASRKQLDYIDSIVEQSLTDAKLTYSQIDAVAVTKSPGLIGSLLVGLSFARALSFDLKKPLIPVDHIHAHLHANFLFTSKYKNNKQKNNFKNPRLPAIGLVVSGGHTSLFYLKNQIDMKLLGQTRDDAAGEAFDKVARILELGYPGGPAIDQLTKGYKEDKFSDLRFTCASFPDKLDFSFSGIKTAVLYYKRDHQNQNHYSSQKVAYAFQKSIVEALVQKCIRACQRYKTKTLLIGGGVAANTKLRKRLTESTQKHRIELHIPPLKLCVDNAAMIARLGFIQLKFRKNNKHELAHA